MLKQNSLLRGKGNWPVHWLARIPCRRSAYFRIYGAS